jgi:general secretion pathway protein K
MKRKNLKQKSNFLFSGKKKNRFFSNQKGIALIVTLVMVTLLAGWAISLNVKVRDLLFEAVILKKRTMLYDRAKAGIEIASMMLVKDKMTSETDSVQEFWADKDQINFYLGLLGFSPDELEIKITDVLSKIQINALLEFPNQKNEEQIRLWERFLDGVRMDHPDLIDNPYDIINPLLDWLDYGDDDSLTGLSGAEEAYYSAENKVPPRNGPLKSVEELSLVKGVNEKLWNKVYNSGIADKYLTAEGDVERSGSTYRYKGRININTAPPLIVSALITDNAFLHMADEICSYREEKSEGRYVNSLDEDWYRKCAGCEDVPLAENLITTSSDVFEVESSASEEGLKVKIRAVLRRYTDKDGKWDIKTEKWIIE